MMIDLRLGDCLELMPTIPDQSVDAIITDPPYPEIDRPYGRLSEAEWWDLMMGVCREARRILRPSGSAVFILQPNSLKAGSMRGWLWEFMAWVCREWNMVQDAWWWNIDTLPSGGATTCGLMRESLKACVWCGTSNCYRKQALCLWTEAYSSKMRAAHARATGEYDKGRKEYVSGHGASISIRTSAQVRGGVTPFNLLPFGNGTPNGHGATTPLALAKWWTRYIVPVGGVCCDPFMGSGTMGLTALGYGDSFIGFEKMPKYFETAQERITEAQLQMSLV